MSLEGHSKVFFGPRVNPTPIEVKPNFLTPGNIKLAKADSFKATGCGLKNLHKGWKPKPLAKPGFLADKTEVKSDPKRVAYEGAKARFEKAEGEVEKAKAEYEKCQNGAKAYADMGMPAKAKAYTAKTAAAKKIYDQKVLVANQAKTQMEKIGAKLAKPATPVKGIAPAGEDLSGPKGLTLAKNHAALSAADKGVA